MPRPRCGRDQGATPRGVARPLGSPNYLSVLETPPVAGRFFSDEDARASDSRVALVSERAWMSRFGGDPSTVGRSLELDGKSYAVVGFVSERLSLVMGSSDVYLSLTTLGGSHVRHARAFRPEVRSS